MESSNPTLKSKIFTDARVFGSGQSMTVQGTVNKTFVLFGVLLAVATWTWSMASKPESLGLMRMLGMGGAIVGLILAIASSFKPKWTPVTAPLYAACQGLMLGGFSALLEMKYPGIVIQSVGLTFGVFLAMLMGYKAGYLQATPAFKKGMMIAMVGLMLFYAVVFIASLFGVQAPTFLNGGGWLGIGFSMFVVGLAAMCLVLDFDFIENAASQGVEKYMEWYGAFSLMVTLVWLYIEILRLLSKLQSSRN